MDIRTLRLFLHLCKSLNFSRTSENMHMSPSTLSRSIQRLEQELGTTLFERDNRQVNLTQAGQEFKQFAEHTLQEWQNLKNTLSSKQAFLSGTLRIYCSVTAAYSHLPSLLDNFRKMNPLVDIVLNTGDAANAVNIIQQNQADIAIAALPHAFPDKLHFTSIDLIPLSIICPKISCLTTELLSQKIIPWQQLPLIVPEHGPGRHRINKWLKDMKINGNIYAQVSGYEAMTSMVALGCGISLIPNAVIDNSPVKNRIKSIKSPITIPPFQLGCCCQKKHVNDAIINAFLTITKENIFPK